MAKRDYFANLYAGSAEESLRKNRREFLSQEINAFDSIEEAAKRGYDQVFQKAFTQILNSLRDKGLENSNPNFHCLGLQGQRPTDPNFENPIQYVFSLKGVELGRFWFTHSWIGLSVTVTSHLVWVEGVDEIIERLL